ncbi:MAG: hypothetical protein RBU21_16990 [FCB group bacterium]|jgi:hypothetical protein|nr:hypothetical protein [FCB group bacterium]
MTSEENEQGVYRIGQVAKIIGRHRSTVRRWATKLGLKAAMPCVEDTYTEANVIALRRYGEAKRRYPDLPSDYLLTGEIARRYGKHPDTIRKAIRRAEGKLGRRLRQEFSVTDHGDRKLVVELVHIHELHFVEGVLSPDSTFIGPYYPKKSTYSPSQRAKVRRSRRSPGR